MTICAVTGQYHRTMQYLHTTYRRSEPNQQCLHTTKRCCC